MHCCLCYLILILKPKEAAVALGMSQRTLWQLTEDWKIPYVQIGGTTRKVVRYVPRDLQAWIEKKKREAQGDESA